MSEEEIKRIKDVLGKLIAWSDDLSVNVRKDLLDELWKELPEAEL